MRLKIVLTLGAMAVLAVIVAGCGGGSTSGSTRSKESTPSEGSATTTSAKEPKSESSSATKRLTNTEFATRVNETCIEVPKNFEGYLEKLKKGGKAPSKRETTLKAAIPPLESAIEEYESLIPPPAEEKKLEKITAAMESAVRGLEADPTAELSGPKSPFAEFQKLSKEYGFQTCEGL